MTTPDPLETAPTERMPSLLSQMLAVGAITALLAAILVPVALNELKKSHDRATKSDVQAIAIAIKAHIDADGELPVLTYEGSDVLVDGAFADTLSGGVELGPVRGDAEYWCIDATQPEGDHAKLDGYHYDLKKDEVVRGLCP